MSTAGKAFVGVGVPTPGLEEGAEDGSSEIPVGPGVVPPVGPRVVSTGDIVGRLVVGTVPVETGVGAAVGNAVGGNVGPPEGCVVVAFEGESVGVSVVATEGDADGESVLGSIGDGVTMGLKGAGVGATGCTGLVVGLELAT